METPTPSSTRFLPISSRNNEEARTALVDITNDSPIVGLAIGNMKTPSSTCCKKRMIVCDDESKQATTPGSGEALLRVQVQTLLQKVEEEAVIKKITFEPRKFLDSPMCVLAPTPANTPQVSDNSIKDSESLTVSPVVSKSFGFFQVLDQQEETEETLEKNVVTTLLFSCFPEKLEDYDSCLDDEDDASVWSVEVNASTSGENEDDKEFELDYEDVLCEVMIMISE